MQAANWLGAELKARRMTQRAFAKAIGLDEVAVSRVIGGHRTLTADEFAAALRVLGYDLPWGPAGAEIQRLVRSVAGLPPEQRRALGAFLRSLSADGG